MKKFTLMLILLVVVLLASLVFIGCPAPSPAGEAEEEKAPETFNLTAASHLGPNQVPTIMLRRWAEEVEQRTGGKVKTKVFDSETLCSGKDTIEMLGSGTCDVALLALPYFPGMFPMTEVVSLPFICYNQSAVGDLLYSLYYDGLMKEYEVYKPLFILPVGPTNLSFTKEKVTKLEDFKGMKVRAPGGPATELVEALGATPTAILTGELYMALERGIIDGVATSIESFVPSKLYEVVKYTIDEPLRGGINFIVMSADTWDRLPCDVKLVVEQVNQKLYYEHLGVVSSLTSEYWATIKAEGVEV